MIWHWLDKMCLKPFGRGNRIFYCVVVLAIYIIGITQWLHFFDYGRIGLNVEDWRAHGPTYDVWRVAIKSGVLPFHFTQGFMTDRYFATPNYSTTPQLLLTTFLTTQQYIIVNTILCCTIAFGTGIWFALRFRLSVVVLICLEYLLCFNGHVLCHLAVGHPEWEAFFFLPLAVGLSFDNRFNMLPAKQIPLLALTLWGMLLQGGLHIYNICFMFLAAIVAFNFSGKLLLRFLILCLISAGLGLGRLVPGFLYFPVVWTKLLDGYSMGYWSFSTLTSWLTSPVDVFNFPEVNAANAFCRNCGVPWEYNIYVGLVGFLILTAGGIVMTLAYQSRRRRWLGLVLPALVFILLSMDFQYLFIRLLRIPFLSNVERIPSRLIMMPLVVFSIIGCANLQVLINTLRVKAGYIILILFLTFQHVFAIRIFIHLWSHPLINARWKSYVAPSPGAVISRPADLDYIHTTIWTWIVSLCSFALLIGWMIWQHRIRAALGKRHAPTG